MERTFNNVKITSSFEVPETRNNLVSGETIGKHFGNIAKNIEVLGEHIDNQTIHAKVWKGTQEEYNAIESKEDDTIYIIKDSDNTLADKMIDDTSITATNKTWSVKKINEKNEQVKDSLNAHAGNADIHVTAAEKAIWNDKADLNQTLRNLTFWSEGDIKDKSLASASGFVFVGNEVTGMPYDNTYWFVSIEHTANHCKITATDINNHRKTFNIVYNDTLSKWDEWINIADGGDAASVNGHTVNSDVPENAFNIMTGATSSAAGTSGLVPVPSAGDQEKVLRGDGTWTEISSGGVGKTGTGTNAEIFNNYEQNTAKGKYSHAEGGMTTALEDYSHIEGYSSSVCPASITNTTPVNDVVALWNNTKFSLASGVGAHVEGRDCMALGNYSHAEGLSSIAVRGHAEGTETYANGVRAHTEGERTTAFGEASHAEGYSSSKAITIVNNSTSIDDIVSSWQSTKFCLTKGQGSHAEGADSLALANYSHAEGAGTIAYGIYSHAEGTRTTALFNQHAQGHYNNTTTATSVDNMGATAGTAFVIGNGTNYAASNAFRITYEGKIYATNATISTGADYAEYFEWADGNLNNEDRVGHFVTFDENSPNMIRIANSTDDYILGIVSGIPSVIGNGDEDWKKRYVLDDFGRYTSETFTYTDIDGTEKTGTHWKQNPDYDPTKKYIPRAERKEWSAVGMLGVLSVRDDGTCVPGKYCTVTNDGTATSSENGYRILRRVSDNVVEILFR